MNMIKKANIHVCERQFNKYIKWMLHMHDLQSKHMHDPHPSSHGVFPPFRLHSARHRHSCGRGIKLETFRLWPKHICGHMAQNHNGSCVTSCVQDIRHMCINICIYIYVCVCMHSACMYSCTYTRVYVYIFYIYLCVCLCVFIYLFICFIIFLICLFMPASS